MLKIWKIGFSVILIFGLYVKFFHLLFLDEFITVLLALLLLLPINLLSLALNTFEAKFNN